jgi:hypothetical protein
MTFRMPRAAGGPGPGPPGRSPSLRVTVSIDLHCGGAASATAGSIGSNVPLVCVRLPSGYAYCLGDSAGSSLRHARIEHFQMREDSRACLRTTGDWTGHYLFVGGARLVSVCKSGTEGQKASGDNASDGFAPRGQPLQSCTVHDAGALDFNDAIPAELILLPAAPPLGSPLAEPPPPAPAPRTTALARRTQHHPRTAGGRKHPLTAPLLPMHAAYHRGLATSAAASSGDSVPATLPQLL